MYIKHFNQPSKHPHALELIDIYIFSKKKTHTCKSYP